MGTNNRVVDAPVARTTDPIESFEAGEDRQAREASEREVLAILQTARRPLSDWQIEQHHDIAASLTGSRWTPQRLRTARAQLVSKHLVIAAGRRERASASGRAAMTWTAVQS